MATKIVTKNSSTASAVPTASDLVQGELAVNVADKRLFTEDNGGSIIELGTNPSTLTVDTDTLAVDATNNRVGIGTASPSAPLHVQKGSAGSSAFPSGDWAAKIFNQTDASTEHGLVVANRWQNDASTAFEVGGLLDDGNGFDTWMRVAGDGKVGIGTATPASNFHINSSGTNVALQLTNSGTGASATDGFIIETGTGGFTTFAQKQTSGIAFTIAGSEAGRFASGGQWLIGRTATGILAEEAGVMLKPDGLLLTAKDGTAEQTHVEFVNNADVTAARVGTIKTSGSTTSYNTSSDYRLKTDAQPMTGATDRLKALNPVNFQWILDGTRVDGFFAHEVADVVPEAISGDKDAVDEEGNPDYQGIDQSKLVPLLVATIQELEARITTLENN